jgi:hypothetical protein
MKDGLGKKPWHKTRNTALISACVLAIVFCSALILLERKVPRIDQRYYANALKAASTTQSVVVKGIAYTVEKGDVYRSGAIVAGGEATAPLLIAYEKTVAERSPLIALPGTDPDRLDLAIRELEETSQELAAVQKDAGRQALVENSLYPIDFLQKASALERARQAFLASGSDTDASVYEKDAAEASQAFQSDLDKYQHGFALTVPTSAPPYVMLKNYATYESVVASLAQLRAGMQETADALNKRAQCFSGVASACRAQDIALPALTIPTTPAVSPNLVAQVNERLLRAPLKEKLEGTDLSQEPYMELSDPGCVPDPSAPQLFLLRIAPFAGGATYKNPLMLTDDRLVDATKQENIPFFKFFADRGVTYVTSTAFLYYECVNYTRDSGRLLGMDAVRTYALDTPLSGSLSKQDPELVALGRIFSSQAQPITENDTTLYASLVEQAAYAGAIPRSNAKQAFDLALGVQDGSAEYDSQILNIAQIEQTNVRLYKEGVPVGLDAPDLFYTRSALTTLFMAANPSVSGTHEDLYPEASAPEDQPYLYYSSLSPQGKIQANNDQEFYFLLHNDPNFVIPAPTQ